MKMFLAGAALAAHGHQVPRRSVDFGPQRLGRREASTDRPFSREALNAVARDRPVEVTIVDLFGGSWRVVLKVVPRTKASRGKVLAVAGMGLRHLFGCRVCQRIGAPDDETIERQARIER